MNSNEKKATELARKTVREREKKKATIIRQADCIVVENTIRF